MPTMKKPLKQDRKKQRGAALVEAAVVIPSMLIFLGCIVFVHNSYDMKITKQTGTRAGTLYYASHACKGEVPADVSPPIADTDPGMIPGGPASANNASKLGSNNSPGASAGIKRDWNLVKANPPDSISGGSAVSDGRRVYLKRNISAGSEVACNEEVFPNKWTAVFQEIGSLYKSAGGLK